MTKSNVSVVTSVAANKLPQNMSLFEGVPTGLEKLTSRDIIIPRLTILQQLSPQLAQGKPEHDKNAKAGDIYDVGLQERFEQIVFIPVHYAKAWIEWAPRGSGKGLVAIHNTDAILEQAKRNDRNQPVMPNGNYIAETAQLFGINVTADMRRSFLPMASTQLKKVKRLLTIALAEKVPSQSGNGTFTPPLYYRSYNLSTAPESNAMGNWFGWKIERGQSLLELFPDTVDRIVNEDIRPFRDSLAKGEVSGDLSGIEHEDEEERSF